MNESVPDQKGFRYRAFISYSHQDAASAAWLHRRIEAFRPRRALDDPALPERLAPVFRDREELASSADLGAVIERALDDSEFLIVMCSAAAAESRWVNTEIEYFKRRRGDTHVLAYIVADEPPACFPPALLAHYREDGSVDEEAAVEHVAADQRVSGDGRVDASRKIIAGMLGVGLDRVRNREQQQRNRRLAMITAASLVGFVVAAGLAFSAIVARDEADRQRQRAEAQALTAQRTSDFLVDIFRVASPSEARGQEITAAEILERGVDRISQLDDEPRIQGNLLHTMGLAHLGLGLYTQSSALLERASEVRTAAGGGRPASQVALAEALMFSGELERAQSVIDQALERVPDEWDTLQSQAYNVAGDIAVKAQKAVEAERLYARALAEDERALAIADPQTSLSAALARSESGLATAYIYQGRFADAAAYFERSLNRYISAYGELHPQVAVTYNNLGNTHYFLQQWDEVLHYYGKAVPLAKRLLGDEHPEVAALLNNSGRVALENGSPSEGAELLAQAVSIYEDTPGGEEGLLFALNSLALAQLDRSEVDAALATQARALDLGLVEHRLSGPLKINHALSLLLAEDPEAARSVLDAADAALAKHYPAGDWRYAWASAIRAALDGRTDALSAAEAALVAIKGADNWFVRQAGALAERG